MKTTGAIGATSATVGAMAEETVGAMVGAMAEETMGTADGVCRYLILIPHLPR